MEGQNNIEYNVIFNLIVCSIFLINFWYYYQARRILGNLYPTNNVSYDSNCECSFGHFGLQSTETSDSLSGCRKCDTRWEEKNRWNRSIKQLARRVMYHEYISVLDWGNP